MVRTMNKEWQVGRMLEPQEDDRKFDCEMKAINVAQRMSVDEPNEVFAVWKNDHPEWLFVGGEQYRRM